MQDASGENCPVQAPPRASSAADVSPSKIMIQRGTITPPDVLPDAHLIARIVKAEGKNLYSAELPNGKSVLAELEAKFRSTVWIKRGSYVVVDTSALAERDNKLDGEIVNVVRDEKAWRKMAYWCVMAMLGICMVC
jgi:translation initiation factor IF-1